MCRKHYILTGIIIVHTANMYLEAKGGIRMQEMGEIMDECKHGGAYCDVCPLSFECMEPLPPEEV